jgi:hypothetical protein
MPVTIIKQPLSSGSGDFGAVTFDAPKSQTAWGGLMSAAANLTASVTAGSSYFEILQLNACDVTWHSVLEDPNDGELPAGHGRVGITEYIFPTLTPVGSSNGVNPLAVEAGQWVGLYVSVDVPPGSSLTPGPFTGTAVIQGGSFFKTVELHAVYVAGVGLQMQYQEMSEWCWIAVATSISQFYNDSGWTQCALATAEITQVQAGTCCPDAQIYAANPGLVEQVNNPYSSTALYCLDPINNQLTATPTGVCNHSGDIGGALTRTGNLNSYIASAIGIPALLNELSAGHPVVIFITWSGGGAGHVIAASGVEPPDTVIIDDPAYGPSVQPYQTLATHYQGSGSWTDSYLTQP